MQAKTYTGEMVIGIVGGSGLYNIEGIENKEEITIETPYGAPSDAFVVGQMHGVKVVFLARHGRHHSFLPSEVPYRANIYAFKKLGVSHLLSISAVGSLREELPPRDMVVVNQYIDNTKHRTSTFFGEGMVAHVSMAKPTCENLGAIVYECAQNILKDSPQKVHKNGTYLCMEGPQFSSLAESLLYRSMHVDVIGMTNMPEAKLAREAQIAYAPLAMVTDYDCWHSAYDDEEEAVTVEMLIGNLKACAENAQKILVRCIAEIATRKPTSIAHTSLDTAVFTPYEALSAEKKALLNFLKGK